VLDGAGSWGPIQRAGRLASRRAACRPGPDRLPARPCPLAHALATVLREAPSAARSGPMSRSTTVRRSVGRRRLPPSVARSSVRVIAPDAAVLRSRHVARRMDCGSSWTLLRITTVAVVDVGRAQVAARCTGDPPRVRLPTLVSLHLRDASPQLRHEIWSRSARAALPPSLGFP
jgi:hypothetical protein